MTGNGIASITKTSTSGLVDTYTITYTNGNTTTFTITNGEDGEVTETELDVLRQKVADQQKVIDQLPQVTGQGTEITLENTIEAQFTEFEVKGHSEQETTEGYNLLNIVNLTTTTRNGITLTKNNDGTITLNGTASSDANFRFAIDNIVATSDYKVQIYKKGGSFTNNYISIYLSVDSSFSNFDLLSMTSNDMASMSLGNKTYTYAQIKLNTGVVCNNLVVGFQIVNDASITEFEKYTNGASPNSTYPQGINSCGDNVNEFNPELAEDNKYQNVVNSWTITTLSTFWVSGLQEIKENTAYIMNYIATTIAFYDENRGIITTTNAQGTSSFITPENAHYCNMCFKKENVTFENKAKIKLEKGTVATPYSPYGMGSINEKIQNKNIFDGEMELGTLSNDDGRPVNINTQIRTKNFTRVKSNSVCSLSNSNNYNTFIYMYDKNKKFIKYINSASFTTTEGTKFIKFRTVGNQTDLTTKFQLEYGNATDIVSHEEQNISIPTQHPMMDDDYFDRENNEEVHTWQKIVLDGSSDEDWVIQNNRYFVCTTSKEISGKFHNKWFAQVIGPGSLQYAKSNIGVIDYRILDWGTGFGLALAYGVRINLENINTSKGGTVEQLRAYLAENPITVYVKFKESAYEKLPFTQEQIDAFNEVDEAYSYKGGTYISSEDEIKPRIKVSGLRDLNVLFNN